MSFPIAQLRDDFTDNVQSPLWSSSAVTGSATKAETGGQARFTLPSITAGSHLAYYLSIVAFDLTGDSCYWNIDTMVATGVAATAIVDLRSSDSQSALRWTQTSGTLKAQTVVAGVATDQYSVAWNAVTYKYLRVRESGGTVFFDSSLNGTAWTNRASLANPFAVTSLYPCMSASCGNVASPGSLRIEAVNVPATSATWRETTADWSNVNRLRSVTLAASAAFEGVLVTADTMDETSRALGGTVRYFAAPLGSASGGYLAMTEYASLALAEASAFTAPLNGRVDLPVAIDARYMRLYHRSLDGSAHVIREYMPRRLVQGDDLEVETISAINIAAAAVTADKIFVLTLGAIVANIGKLNIDATGYLYQGSGTGDSPTTGLKVYNSGGIGKLSTYNAGVEQVTLDTDGALKAGTGQTYLDATGANIVVNSTFSTRDAYKFVDSAGGAVRASWAVYNPVGGPYSLLQLNSQAGKASALELRSTSAATFASSITLNAQSTSSNTASFLLNANSSGSYILWFSGQSAAQTETRLDGRLNVGSGVTGTGDGDIKLSGGLNVGTATGAGAGEVVSSGTLWPIFSDAATNSTVSSLIAQHLSSGTPIAGFGVDMFDQAHTSTNTVRNMFLKRTTWATATDASRKARTDFHTYDTTNRLAIRIEASGSAAMIGFLGASAVVRPTVTGSRAGNAALASLLTAMANFGLITDSTTA